MSAICFVVVPRPFNGGGHPLFGLTEDQWTEVIGEA